MKSTVPVCAKVTWTYDDYRQMPDDGCRYEVLDGDLFVTPAPTVTHQTVSKRLQLALMLQIERTGQGVVFNAPVDVIFASTRVAQPDLLVVRTERRSRVSDRGIEGAPDLIIEILSPGTADVDRGRKAKLYAAEGVREYWLADSATHSLDLFELAADGYRQRAHCGPGDTITSACFDFTLPVDEVFAA